MFRKLAIIPVSLLIIASLSACEKSSEELPQSNDVATSQQSTSSTPAPPEDQEEQIVDEAEPEGGISEGGLPYSISREGFVRIPEEYVQTFVPAGLSYEMMRVQNPQRTRAVRVSMDTEQQLAMVTIMMKREDFYENISPSYSRDFPEIWGYDEPISLGDLEDLMTPEQFKGLKCVDQGFPVIVEFIPFGGDHDGEDGYGILNYRNRSDQGVFSVAPTCATEELTGRNTMSNVVFYDETLDSYANED